jgi:hypothetical protein
MRIVCHCTICQEFNGAPYADVVAFRGGAISTPAAFPVTFKKYRPPPNVSRGLCQKCGKPVVEFLALAPYFKISFVPSTNFQDIQKLPAPGAHIFYHRRVKDLEDSVPKISGYWPSELAVGRLILAGLFRR